jgi:hypothetical protein
MQGKVCDTGFDRLSHQASGELQPLESAGRLLDEASHDQRAPPVRQTRRKDGRGHHAPVGLVEPLPQRGLRELRERGPCFRRGQHDDGSVRASKRSVAQRVGGGAQSYPRSFWQGLRHRVALTLL